MSIFALVHGAWHGPWSWERVVGPLQAHGHEVVLPDLPSEDPDLAPDDARSAAGRLRFQARRSQTERSPEPPAGLRVESILGTEDRLVNPDWSRRVARERLGVEPVELPTGHFPMITHPELLAERLAQLDAE